jgi:hypothetical protein
MSIKREEFLTKAMGECYHEPDEGLSAFLCKHCKQGSLTGDFPKNIKFSTEVGFFKLWRWAQRQDWWDTFKSSIIGHPGGYGGIDSDFVDPETFANVVYNFLTARTKL